MEYEHYTILDVVGLELTFVRECAYDCERHNVEGYKIFHNNAEVGFSDCCGVKLLRETALELGLEVFEDEEE